MRTIQAAVNAAIAGTAVMVKAGTYTGTVQFFEPGGTTTSPILLISADGPGAATITQSGASNTVFGYGVENIVIYGFKIIGGTLFTQAKPNDFSNLCRNIVFQKNIGIGGSEDVLKFGGCVGIYILENDLSQPAMEEGIDLVAVDNAVVAKNIIHDIVHSGLNLKVLFTRV
jgi:hypothetical protein